MTPLLPGRGTHLAPRPTRRSTGRVPAAAVALLLGLAACGGSDDAASSPDDQIAEAVQRWTGW